MKTSLANLLFIFALLPLFAVWCGVQLWIQRRAWLVLGTVGIAATALAVAWLVRRAFRSLMRAARELYLMLLMLIVRRQIAP